VYVLFFCATQRRMFDAHYSKPETFTTQVAYTGTIDAFVTIFKSQKVECSLFPFLYFILLGISLNINIILYTASYIVSVNTELDGIQLLNYTCQTCCLILWI